MKILITSDWYYPVVNGVVRSILNLKEYLENKGHEVRVLTLSNTLTSYKSEGVYYIGSLSAKKIYPEARISNVLATTYLRSIRKWEPDVIHSQCEFSTFMMAKTLSKMLKIPLIHTYHTVYEDYTHYFISNKKAGVKIVAKFSKTISDLCDYIVVPSEKTSNILKSYDIESNKLVVIPTGVKIPEIYNKDLRSELGIRKDQRVILYLGRLAAEKNIEELIEFYNKIDLENLKFYIVGGGPYLDKLREFSKAHSKEINFVGMVDPSEVNKYYQAADIFVSASTSETQGLTYYEALSNGTVSLCRDDVCLDGVITNGFNGYRYKTYEEFKKYLGEILLDKKLEEKLKKNARTYALEKFSIKSFGESCESLYKKAVNEYNYESSFIHKRL